MMRKYKYSIIFNENRLGKAILTYSFQNTKNIQIYVGKQCATSSFEMTKRYEVDEVLNFKAKIFRDIFRKIYLLHYTKESEGLIVKTIIIVIDGAEFVLDNKCEAFPFVYSMLTGKANFELPAFNNEKLMNIFLNQPKTIQDKDYRFASISAFYASSSKKFLIDTFSNLWTALNAYYNYYGFCFENELKEKYNLKSRNDIPKYLRPTKIDSDGINILMLMIKPGNLKCSRDLIKKSDYMEVEKCISALSYDDIDSLYDYSEMRLKTKEINETFSKLEECVKKFKQDIYIFLLLEYSYYLRCDYFHGNRSMTIISIYNDPENKVFRVVNMFISRFLKDNIGKLYSDSFFDEKKFALIINAYKKKDKNKYDEAIRGLEKKGYTNSDLYR